MPRYLDRSPSQKKPPISVGLCSAQETAPRLGDTGPVGHGTDAAAAKATLPPWLAGRDDQQTQPPPTSPPPPPPPPSHLLLGPAQGRAGAGPAALT